MYYCPITWSTNHVCSQPRFDVKYFLMQYITLSRAARQTTETRIKTNTLLRVLLANQRSDNRFDHLHLPLVNIGTDGNYSLIEVVILTKRKFTLIRFLNQSSPEINNSYSSFRCCPSSRCERSCLFTASYPFWLQVIIVHLLPVLPFKVVNHIACCFSPLLFAFNTHFPSMVLSESF